MSDSDLIEDEDFDVCRICLVESEAHRYIPFVHIMSPINGKLNAKIRMLELLGIDVDTNDFKPKRICKYCSKSLENWNNMRKKASESAIVINYLASKKARAGAVTKIKQKCFTCDVCNASFKEKHHIARHCKIHTGDKPYKCNICKKLFRDQSNLLNHKYTHNKAKRYQCTQCGRKFVKNDNLLVHFRTHSHEKPYECDVCRKKFFTSGNLSRHKRTTHK